MTIAAGGQLGWACSVRRPNRRRCRRRRDGSERAGSKELGADGGPGYILHRPARDASLCCKSVTCNVNTPCNGHSSLRLSFPSKPGFAYS